jgi:hypothetical protein
MPDNPPPPAGGFTHSGHEAPLVNEKNNLDKTKTEYNTGVSMTLKLKDNERKRKPNEKEGIRPNRNQTNCSGRRPPFLSILSASRWWLSGP